MEFTEKELITVWSALGSFMEDSLHFVQDQIEGDASGIKNNLEVQNITYQGLCRCVDGVRLAKKLEGYFEEHRTWVNTWELVSEWKEEIAYLNLEILSIQNGQKDGKIERN